MPFDPVWSGMTIISLFVFLVFQGVPIGLAFGISGFLGIAWARGFEVALSVLGTIAYTWASSPLLLPMPLFIFMGFLAFNAEISRDLYEAAFRWFGRLPGGLAIATSVANAAFGAICGSAQAAAAAMSPIAYPEMQKKGYDRKLSTGSLAAGGTLSFLIPPSIPFILYGVLAEVSIGKLFIAGFLPGLIMCSCFCLLIFIWCKKKPQYGPPGPKFELRQKIVALKKVLGMLLLFLLVIGGLYLGAFSPSEAGAIGAFGAFIIGIFMRRLNVSKVMQAAKQSARLVCFVMMIIIGAQIFNTFLGVSGFNRIFSEWILGLKVSKYTILLFLTMLFLLIGMFLDIAAVLLLLIPTLSPIMKVMGFDLLWLGVYLVLIQSIGFISPPIGMNAFIVQGVTGVPVEDVFKGALPFVVVMLVIVALMIIFPGICTWLPSLV